MDIQACKGNGCLLRDKCKRATATPHERQAWFTDEPFRIVDGKFTCEMFWETMNQFKEITNEEARGNDDKGIDENEGSAGSETQTDNWRTKKQDTAMTAVEYLIKKMPNISELSDKKKREIEKIFLEAKEIESNTLKKKKKWK